MFVWSVIQPISKYELQLLIIGDTNAQSNPEDWILRALLSLLFLGYGISDRDSGCPIYYLITC